MAILAESAGRRFRSLGGVLELSRRRGSL